MQARMHNASCVVRRLLRVLALRAVPQRRRGARSVGQNRDPLLNCCWARA
jgi:hypothetical protein